MEEVFCTTAHTIYHVWIDGKEEIKTTAYHPVYVEGQGWVTAINLREGDAIETVDGMACITKIVKERHEEPVPVYNFHVKEWASYFVGEVRAYVHNGHKHPDDYSDAWKAIDDFRERTYGFEPLGDYIPKQGDGKGTVSFIEINGEKIFGVNSSQLSQLEKKLGRDYFEKMKKAGSSMRGRWYGDSQAQILTHAEGHALMKAHNKYGKIVDKCLTMFCDRETCRNCRKNLVYLLEYLGIDELKIINKNGIIHHIKVKK